MRTKLFLAAVLMAALPALATPFTWVTLTVVGESGNTYDGQSSMYQDIIQVTGQDYLAAPVAILPVPAVGTSWLARQYDPGNPGFPNKTWNELGWLFEQDVLNGGSDTGINGAAIYDFSGSGVLVGTAAFWVSAAAAATDSGPGEYTNLRFYTDNVGRPYFLASATPEPSSLLMFGAGVAGLAGWLRKRMA
jgi:hypothetical protein